VADKGTEQATPLRRKKALERGDGVHSRELLSAMAMLGGITMLGAISNSFVLRWAHAYTGSLSTAVVGLDGVSEQNSEELLIGAVRRILIPALLPAGLILVASFSGALVSGVAQSRGLQIRPSALALKFGKLNPVANLGNLFSLRSTIRVAKSLMPAGVMALLGWGALKSLMIPMPVMSL